MRAATSAHALAAIGQSRSLPFTIEESNKCLGISERVVYRMVIVFCPTQPLPLLSASKITHQTRVEVGNAPPGMPERVFAEVTPEIEVDPLEVVRRIV
jgi:hypothetical protein